ncbi:ABC transporter ATP-binding protein [Flaviflexus equikiangi]|uniref:ABC transporter ATP-binding protein n=1 Tax=Flaviflexus equikiangi TaxID=2758573 RepID=UPI0015F6480B|nr:ATP-binding cassette domain-containing protein [Flaviflexus equikiangi]
MTIEGNGRVGIKVSGLTQGYGRREVLKDFSLEVPDRSIVALVGPNGAGKTTLMRTIATLLKPKAGSIVVLGHDIATRQGRNFVRRNLGYLPQDFSADEKLTVEEYVEYSLWMRGLSKADIRTASQVAIGRVQLSQAKRVKLGELSGGMRQRAGIAAVTAGDPDLLILDEPTSGLDPEQRSQFREVLRAVDSRLVLISTHLIVDVASLADFLIVIAEGSLAYAGSADILREGD